MSSIIIMSLPGVHNQVKKLHNTITSLEFCISNNTKVSSPIQRYPLHRCWTGISQSLVLAIEIKSIKFNIHFWKKWQKKEQSNNHWLGWQIISNITACESHWHTLHHSQEQHFKKPETLLRWAKNIQNTVRSMNN